LKTFYSTQVNQDTIKLLFHSVYKILAKQSEPHYKDNISVTFLNVIPQILRYDRVICYTGKHRRLSFNEIAVNNSGKSVYRTALKQQICYAGTDLFPCTRGQRWSSFVCYAGSNLFSWLRTGQRLSSQPTTSLRTSRLVSLV
jgi:hypothetical protein